MHPGILHRALLVNLPIASADSKTDITLQPQPSEPEIQFILDAIAEYLTVAVSTAQHCCGVAQSLAH
jgi:hypothetical protein